MIKFESRSTDIPWKQKDVEAAVKRLVDSQYLKKSDEDGFYTELKEKIEEKRAEEQATNEALALKRYKNEELFCILEKVEFNGIADEFDFSEAFEKAKEDSDFEFHEYYYPTAYNKSEAEIFQDLLNFNLIFQCTHCGNYFKSVDQDDEHKELCQTCGEEKWLEDLVKETHKAEDEKR